MNISVKTRLSDYLVLQKAEKRKIRHTKVQEAGKRHVCVCVYVYVLRKEGAEQHNYKLLGVRVRKNKSGIFTIAKLLWKAVVEGIWKSTPDFYLALKYILWYLCSRYTSRLCCGLTLRTVVIHQIHNSRMRWGWGGMATSMLDGSGKFT